MSEKDEQEQQQVEGLGPEGGPGVSHHTERDAALAAVLRHEAEMAEMEDRYRELVEKKTGFGIRHVVLVVLTLLTAWAWILPPGPIRLAEPSPPPLFEEEASLRMVIYLQAQRVEEYVREHGRTPGTLSEAGPVYPGMDYVRLTGRHYRIVGRTGRLALSYSSAESADEFVRRGSQVIDPGMVP